LVQLSFSLQSEFFRAMIPNPVAPGFGGFCIFLSTAISPNFSRFGTNDAPT
jgi:hypothetical protein